MIVTHPAPARSTCRPTRWFTNPDGFQNIHQPDEPSVLILLRDNPNLPADHENAWEVVSVHRTSEEVLKNFPVGELQKIVERGDWVELTAHEASHLLEFARHNAPPWRIEKSEHGLALMGGAPLDRPGAALCDRPATALDDAW